MAASSTKHTQKQSNAAKKAAPKPHSPADRNFFDTLAQRVAIASGSYITFLIAAGLILAWAVAGPFFHFSDTWQLVINTSTTIITFLMVFLIQNTQSRDTQALQLKLDELIRVTKGARSTMLDLEDCNNLELKEMHDTFVKLAEKSGRKQKAKD